MTDLDPGLDFELLVMRMISRSLQAGALGISPVNAKIYHHKDYYSIERHAPIIFDIAIEVFRKGATEPFLIWIWECKNYTRPVPVDDVEEFHAKLQQIGSDRTKGTIVSTATFQSGSLAYAKTHGIGLARIIKSKGITFDLENMAALTEGQIESCLTSDYTKYKRVDAVGFTAHGVLIAGFDKLIHTEIA